MKHIDKFNLIKSAIRLDLDLPVGDIGSKLVRHGTIPAVSIAAFKAMQSPMSEAEQLAYESAKNKAGGMDIKSELQNLFKTKNNKDLMREGGGDILGMAPDTAKMVGVGGGTMLLSYLLNKMLNKPQPPPPQKGQGEGEDDAGLFIPNKVIQHDYASRRLAN